MAWKVALSDSRAVHGAKEFRNYALLDVRISAVIANRDGSVILEMRSPNPEKTKAGLKKFEQTFVRSLSKYYVLRLQSGPFVFRRGCRTVEMM